MAKTEPFEKFPAPYDEWFEENPFAYESELRAVKSLLPAQGTGLEIGVGTGRFAARLGIPLGVEPSAAMAQFARQRGIEVVQAVAESLPFGDGRFDFVLMVTTLCFLDQVAVAFREAYRVLRPRGSFLVGFIDRESRLGGAYERQKPESRFYSAARFYSVPEVISFAESTGFAELRFVQTIFRDLRSLRYAEEIRSGYGEGSFVVMKATKPNQGASVTEGVTTSNSNSAPT